jgi:hypothetical protein
MKKLIALFLVITFMGMNCTTYERGEGINLETGQKPGAKVIIQKIDGQQARGELIAVKKNSLLLLESKSGVDCAVSVAEIKTITIGKKSKALPWAGLGFLISSASLSVLWYATDPEGFADPEGGGPFVVALVFGIPGLLLGGGIGAYTGIDKTIKFEGKSEAEIQQILEDLRKEARVPDFQ